MWKNHYGNLRFYLFSMQVPEPHLWHQARFGRWRRSLEVRLQYLKIVKLNGRWLVYPVKENDLLFSFNVRDQARTSLYICMNSICDLSTSRNATYTQLWSIAGV